MSTYNIIFNETGNCNQTLKTSGDWADHPTTNLVNGRRYYAEDRNTEYYYNATFAKWLSTQLFSVEMPYYGGGATDSFDAPTPLFSSNRPHFDYDLDVEKVEINWGAGTMDSTNYFIAQLNLVGNDNFTITPFGSPINLYQDGRSMYNFYRDTIPVYTIFPVDDGTNTVQAFRLIITYEGSPGRGEVNGVTLHYRLVG